MLFAPDPGTNEQSQTPLAAARLPTVKTSTVERLLNERRSGRPVVKGDFDLTALDIKDLSITNATIVGSLRVGAGQHVRLVNAVLLGKSNVAPTGSLRFSDGAIFNPKREDLIEPFVRDLIARAGRDGLLSPEELTEWTETSNIEEYKERSRSLFEQAVVRSLLARGAIEAEHAEQILSLEDKTRRGAEIGNLYSMLVALSNEQIIREGFSVLESRGLIDPLEPAFLQRYGDTADQIHVLRERFEALRQEPWARATIRQAVSEGALSSMKAAELLSPDIDSSTRIAAARDANHAIIRRREIARDIADAVALAVASESDIDTILLEDLNPEDLHKRLSPLGSYARGLRRAAQVAPRFGIETDELCRTYLESPDRFEAELSDLFARVSEEEKIRRVLRVAVQHGLIRPRSAAKILRSPERLEHVADLEERVDKIEYGFELSKAGLNAGILSSDTVAGILAEDDIDVRLQLLEETARELKREENLKTILHQGVQKQLLSAQEVSQALEIQDRGQRIAKLLELRELFERQTLQSGGGESSRPRSNH